MIKGLKAGPRRNAFTAFCREIINSPHLANKRCSFILFDGRVSVADPTIEQMPCIRLALIGGEVERMATNNAPGNVSTITNKYMTTVSVEIWTVGTDVGDSLDLGDVIEDSLFPIGPIERDGVVGRLNRAGVSDWRLTREVAPSDLQSYDSAAIKATGQYQYSLILADT